MKQIHHSFGTLFAAAGLVAAGWVASGTALAADVAWSNGVATHHTRVVESYAPPVLGRRSQAVVRQRVSGTRRGAEGKRPRVEALPQVFQRRAPVQVVAPFHADDRRASQSWHRYARRQHEADPVVPGQDGNWGNN